MAQYNQTRSSLYTNFDIPQWLSVTIVLAVTALIPVSLMYNSSGYLTSERGFADGGDMYSHLTEALYIKERLQAGRTDFWYEYVTLGYPVHIAYQPLPSLLAATTMIATERYIHPHRTFRYLFVAILVAIPLSWYLCCQRLGMTRLQSSMVVLCLFSLRSWVDFGLELGAFKLYGLYTQAYGMLLLPLAVFLSYKYILYNEGSSDITTAIITINLLSHSIFGIYVIVFTVTMVTSLALVQLIYIKRTNGLINVCIRAAEIHGKALVVSGWWLIPTLSCYEYVGGLPWKYDIIHQHTLDIVLRKLLSGEVYDYDRGIPFITLGTLVGIVCICVGRTTPVEWHVNIDLPHPTEDFKPDTTLPFKDCKVFDAADNTKENMDDGRGHLNEDDIQDTTYPSRDDIQQDTPHPSEKFANGESAYAAERLQVPEIYSNVSEKRTSILRQHVVHTWLVLTFTVSFILFLGRGMFGSLYDLIPFHSEMESLRYLNALHFLGLILFGIGTSFVMMQCCQLLSAISGIAVNQIVVMVMVLVVPFYLSNLSQRLANQFTVTEVDDKLRDNIRLLKEHSLSGRLYGNKAFDTSGPWKLNVLPYLSRKPGVQTYSRGYHDSLTTYYLESFKPNLTTTPWFPDLLRLFNIRYTLAKTISTEFLEHCQLYKLIDMNEDMTVYVRAQEDHYGYFEFVNIPGSVIINGDLKGIRDTVVILTQVFQVRVLLGINLEVEATEHSRDSSSTSPKIKKRPLSAREGGEGEVEQDINVNVKVEPVFTPLNWRNPFSILLHYFGRPERYFTTWMIDGVSLSAHDFLDKLMTAYLYKPLLSAVLKESAEGNRYSATVKVPEQAYSKGIYSAEHLLLKVTYHPYWSCRYSPTDNASPSHNTKSGHDDVTEQDGYDKWIEVKVHHVIPNLMSIVLPPGEHEVVCEYANPLYQKIGFLLFILIILLIFIKEILIIMRRIYI